MRWLHSLGRRKVRTSEPKPMVFFVPHQDDEYLTFGLAILRASQTHDVHVVLCTDGSLDDTRNQLGSGKRCYLPELGKGRRIHFGRHRYDISIQEFIGIRDEEFRTGCELLGVRPNNVHIAPNRAVDGSLSPDLASDIIRDYLSTLPEAVVCTEVPIDCPLYDPNAPGYSDVYHHALGNGARMLFESGQITELVYYADPYYLQLFKDAAPHIDFKALVPNQTELGALRKAAKAYRRWRPSRRQFAVAWHSASPLFPQVTGDWNNYFYQAQR